MVTGAIVALPAASYGQGATKPVLHGKIESSDHVVRLQRPQTPTLDTSSSARGNSGPLKALVDFGDTDFAHTMQAQQAREDNQTAGKPNATEAEGRAESNELIIAWEAWHKRVCAAIYENWLRNSKILGVAHTTITVTRDRHISVIVKDLQIAPEELNRLPRNVPFAQERLEQEFAREILASVEPLNGLSLLTFPEKSQRQVTEFHPYFKKIGEAGYDWTTDDYERVPLP
jgi:hypothetical protein